MEETLTARSKKPIKQNSLELVNSLNFRNSIFVDNTASEEVSKTYSDYLENSISVVTCNKIACSSEYENYLNLKDLAQKI